MRTMQLYRTDSCPDSRGRPTEAIDKRKPYACYGVHIKAAKLTYCFPLSRPSAHLLTVPAHRDFHFQCHPSFPPFSHCLLGSIRLLYLTSLFLPISRTNPAFLLIVQLLSVNSFDSRLSNNFTPVLNAKQHARQFKVGSRRRKPRD
jgi:hypothetical protein